MTGFNNAMEIFTLLDKSNCRKCNEPTCLAFASRVFLGTKSLDQCPSLDPDILAEYAGATRNMTASEEMNQAAFQALQEKVSTLDLKAAASRVGGVYSDNRLTIRIFGKPFSIDQTGKMFSDIHINPWIAGPVLSYLITCKGVDLTGKWVSFRELSGGREKNSLFVKRSQSSFNAIADQYPGLFEDLIHLFNGEKVENHDASDLSLKVYPLPRLPVLICYWKPEEGLASDLKLFFDSSADLNADIDIVYGICAGIVVMFEKLALTHGVKVSS